MIELSMQFVRQLINAQFPEWNTLEIRPVLQSGHDNRTFHLGENMTIRLPSNYKNKVEIWNTILYLQLI